MKTGKKKLTREDGNNLSFLVETIPGATKSKHRVSESCLNLLIIFFVCFWSGLDGQYRLFEDGFDQLHDVVQLKTIIIRTRNLDFSKQRKKGLAWTSLKDKTDVYPVAVFGPIQ